MSGMEEKMNALDTKVAELAEKYRPLVFATRSSVTSAARFVPEARALLTPGRTRIKGNRKRQAKRCGPV